MKKFPFYTTMRVLSIILEENDWSDGIFGVGISFRDRISYPDCMRYLYNYENWFIICL